MISRLRRIVAAPLAILVTVATMGCVRVDRTGGPGAPSTEPDPGGPAVLRTVERGPRPEA